MVDHPEILHARRAEARGQTPSGIYRAAAKGQLVRLAPGAYSPTPSWDEASWLDRYAARVVAAALRRPRAVVSHLSAACLLGLPLLRTDGPVHVTVPIGRTAHSSAAVRVHTATIDPGDVVYVQGVATTGIPRTLVDLAGGRLEDAVVALDAHLFVSPGSADVSPIRMVEVASAFARAQPLRASARTLTALSFAITGAASPLESLSRIALARLGFPEPVTQTEYRDARGLIGYVDFDWPDFAVVGEADGHGKYLDPALRGGRSADQVIVDEKIREDRIRALDRTVARWGWGTIRDGERLKSLLVGAGLPLGEPWVKSPRMTQLAADVRGELRQSR